MYRRLVSALISDLLYMLLVLYLDSFLSDFIASYDVNTSLNFASAASVTPKVCVSEQQKTELAKRKHANLWNKDFSTFIILVLIRMKLQRLCPEGWLQGEKKYAIIATDEKYLWQEPTAKCIYCGNIIDKIKLHK